MKNRLTVATMLCVLAFAGMALAQDRGGRGHEGRGEEGREQAAHASCEHGRGHGRHGHGHMLKKMDTDNDSRITRAEFDAATDARFKRMDANNDGVITTDEIRAGHEAMRERMRERHQGRRGDRPQDGAGTGG